MGANAAPPLSWRILAQSGLAVSCGNDTTEDVLATITVPAKSMGPNGSLRISTQWTVTNSGNAKTPRIRFSGAAGTTYWTFTAGAIATVVDQRYIHNAGAANAQVGAPSNAFSFAGTTAAKVTSAVDTDAADTTVVISGQKASAGETLTLDRYVVELAYGA